MLQFAEVTFHSQHDGASTSGEEPHHAELLHKFLVLAVISFLTGRRGLT
jgi:hypothetical protein